MKKFIALTLAATFAIGTMALADIQSPPGHQFGWSRKLSRALANLAYGGTELLAVCGRKDDPELVWNLRELQLTQK